MFVTAYIFMIFVMYYYMNTKVSVGFGANVFCAIIWPIVLLVIGLEFVYDILERHVFIPVDNWISRRK